MALNGDGRVPSKWNNNYGLFFEWSADRKIVENESEITATVYADFIDTATISVSARPDGKMSIAGQEDTVYMPAVSKLNNGNVKIKLGTIKKTVKHLDDGTLPNVVLKAVWPIRATISGTYRSTIEGAFNTGEITQIARASSILSSADFTLENNLKVSLKKYFDIWRHDVTLKINGSNFKTLTNVDTEATFTFNSTEINNLYSGSANESDLETELIVTTKNSGIVIGTTNKKGFMYIDPIKNAPIFTNFEFKPDSKTSSATGWNSYIDTDNGLSVLGHTIYTIKPGIVTPKNGATITGFEISLNNRVYKATGDEFTLSNAIAYNDNLIVSVVDSRGFKTAVTKGIKGQQYSKIVFNNLSIKRRSHPNQTEINFVIEGKIFKNLQVSNQITSRFRSKEVGGSYGNWINLASNFTVQSNGTFTANFNRTGFDSNKNYEIEFEIGDSFYTEQPFKSIINKEVSVFKITKDNVLVNEQPVSGISLLDVYPVGAIYMSVVNIEPSILFGGTWERWARGRVPVGVNDSEVEFDNTEKTGGNKSMQIHAHDVIYKGNGRGVNLNASGSAVAYGLTGWGSTALTATPELGTTSAGTGNSGNLQPYITCYMWKRTA